MSNREEFLKLVSENISKYYFHTTLVQSYDHPRYAYTIGITEKLGFELILCGGIYFNADAVFDLINNIFEYLNQPNFKKIEDCLTLNIDGYGLFTLNRVDESWLPNTMLGYFDYYNTTQSPVVYQITPESKHYTCDIPKMNSVLDGNDIVWKWLKEEWKMPIPQSSNVIINLSALQGSLITEITRWEEDEWEMFTEDPDNIPKDKIRIVPFSVILGSDPSIKEAMLLQIGKGIYRSSLEEKWQEWG